MQNQKELENVFNEMSKIRLKIRQGIDSFNSYSYVMDEDELLVLSGEIKNLQDQLYNIERSYPSLNN
jgi:hypothetical protein